MAKFSSLAALKVVKMTTFSAASDENLIKMTTFPFQCRRKHIKLGTDCTLPADLAPLGARTSAGMMAKYRSDMYSMD